MKKVGMKNARNKNIKSSSRPIGESREEATGYHPIALGQQINPESSEE